MRAIPLWQPWASLIAIGAKSIETRSWPAPSTVLGQRIAIHATKTRDHLDVIRFEPTFRGVLRAALDDGTLQLVDDDLPLGAIVCTAVVAECQPITASSAVALLERDPREHHFGNYAPGRYAWILEDVRRLPAPVAFRGSRRIFEVPDEVLGQPPAPRHEQGALL